MEAASTVVIKVKYRDVLRRFDAQIVNEELDLSMDGLKEKIISLFSLAPGTELMLTYIDQDGDVVTLGNADDLRDVVKQGLDPLRITVKLHRPLQNLHDGVSRILKNVPDPLRETLMKLSVDLTSKCITELVDCFSKIGLSYLGQLYESQTRAKPSTNSSFPENSRSQTITKDTDMSKANAAIPKVQSNDIEEPSFKSNESLTKLQHEATTETNKLRLINITGGSMETSSSKALGLKAASLALDFKNSNVGKKEQTLGESSCISSDPPSVGNIVPTEKEVNEPNDPNVGPKIENITASDTTKEDYIGGRIGCVFPDVLGCSPGSLLMPTPGISNLTGSLSGHSPTYENLFSGIPDGNTSAAPSLPVSQAVYFRSSSTQNDDLDILLNWDVLHRGVRCDGCGIHPITGPRFKSKINVDYDLCNICFSVIGNDTDFIRIDQPMVHQKHMSSKGYCDPYQIPTLPQVCSWVSKKKSCASKLDSCFIQNVTVTDGTIMAPLTPFTKIWRMRNNGMVVWPQKTQLIWTGGDRLTNQFSVEVEIPVIGLRVDEDLDIAVDLIAPEFPGRYISYWRMVSPSGQKFGQRVWVLIQVDASVKETAPPVSSSLIGPEVISECGANCGR